MKKYNCKQKVRVICAWIWQLLYKCSHHIHSSKIKHAKLIYFLGMMALFIGIHSLLKYFQVPIIKHFSSKDEIDALLSVYQVLGGALIGSSIIVFTFVMFAMQVNVERMPYGLFHKFSSDRKLLGAFFTTFLLSIIIILLSLADKILDVLLSINIAAFSIVLMLALYLYAFNRALSLINPTQQLIYIFQMVKINFLKWDRAIKRSIPLLEREPSQQKEAHGSSHDGARLLYFQKVPHWNESAKKSIDYCCSYAKQYAETRDYEVLKQSLETIVAINHEYIKVKGKTFFTSTGLPNFENPLTTDDFINYTLERLREISQIAISNGDEQLTISVFRTFLKLTQIYLSIDYSNQFASKYHAHLAAMYLCNEVEKNIRANNLEVLMEGIRLMGDAAIAIQRNDDPIQILTISEKIALISTAVLVKKDFYPITMAGIECLSKLTYEMLLTKKYDIDHPIKEVRRDINLVAQMCLKHPESQTIFTNCLSSYYSFSNNSFLSWLTNLSNELLKVKEENKDVERIHHHIALWSEDLYENEKQLLQAAITAKSSLASDIIYWIVHVAKILIALSTADSCTGYTSKKLEKNAKWLVYVFTWIPDNKESIQFCENHQLTEKLFETGQDAFSRGCMNLVSSVQDILFKWATMAGKYQNFYHIIKKALISLAVLELIMKNDGTNLISKLDCMLKEEHAPSKETRSAVVKGLQYYLEETTLLYTHFASQIENAILNIDQAKFKKLISDLISKIEPQN